MFAFGACKFYCFSSPLLSIQVEPELEISLSFRFILFLFVAEAAKLTGYFLMEADSSKVSVS